MGFDSAFYAYPKYKNYTYDDYYAMERVLEFFHNPWYKEHDIPTLDKFCEIYEVDKPDEVDITAFLINGSLGKIELGSFCSNSRFFYQMVKEYNKHKENEYSFKFFKEDVILSLNKVFEDFNNKFEVKPITISHSFTETEADEQIKLAPCDGIELSYEDGSIRRVYTTSFDDEIAVVENYDSWEYNGYINIISALIDCLLNVNFDNYRLFYVASW